MASGIVKVDGKFVKVLPESNIAELLTPVTLAYWLAGDGHFVKREGSIQIATHSFTPEEPGGQLRFLRILTANLLAVLIIKLSSNISFEFQKEQLRKYRSW